MYLLTHTHILNIVLHAYIHFSTILQCISYHTHISYCMHIPISNRSPHIPYNKHITISNILQHNSMLHIFVGPSIYKKIQVLFNIVLKILFVLEESVYFFCIALRISSISAAVVAPRTNMPSFALIISLLSHGPKNIFCI